MTAPSSLRAELLACRACLGTLGARSEAGLCGRCWAGLTTLPEGRCPACALAHAPEDGCPEPVAWARGDALWDYHGGRPPLGALLVPGIKAGEWGWKAALLERVEAAPMPDFIQEADLVTAVPTAFWKRWTRGHDLAEEAGRRVASRAGLAFRPTLRRSPFRPGQTGRTESQRRRLPRKAFALRPGAAVEDRTVLLVDDVWTTGTSLARCAEVLRAAGAREVRVLTLFRAL